MSRGRDAKMDEELAKELAVPLRHRDPSAAGLGRTVLRRALCWTHCRVHVSTNRQRALMLVPSFAETVIRMAPRSSACSRSISAEGVGSAS